MRKESDFLFILRNIVIILFFFSYGQGAGLTINLTINSPTHLTNELFQFRRLCYSFGGGSLSSEMLPAASLLHSQVQLRSSQNPVSREPITLPAEGAETPAWDWR